MPHVPSTAPGPHAVPATPRQRLRYPDTKRGEQVDDYHGTRVADPYRWLEDVDAPDTRAWIDAQNAVTSDFLAAIPERDAIRRRLTALWDYPRYGTPFKKRGQYFFFKNDGLQNQAVLYRQPSLARRTHRRARPERAVARRHRRPLHTRPLGRRPIPGLRDRRERVGLERHPRPRRGERPGSPRPAAWAKFSGLAWTHDHAGFFYSRYPAPAPADDNPLLAVNRFHRLYYHRLGTPQDADQLVFERPDQPDWGVMGRVSEDGRYLVLSLWLGTDRRNRVYYMDLRDPLHPDVAATPVTLLDEFDASYGFVANHETEFHFRTDLDAPRGRLVTIDLRHPERAHWREIIPQAPDVLESVILVRDRFVTLYLVDAHSQLRLFRQDGSSAGIIPLPDLGTAGELSVESAQDTELFFAFTTYLDPTTIYRHDFDTGRTEVFKAPQLAFDPSRFVTEQVFYASKDGTRIPMYLTHRRDLVRDGTNPTYLYGYGGFDISLTPAFSPVCWCGSKWAASSPSRTCGAAGNTGRRGTKPGCTRRSRRCSTTSWPRRSG